MDTNLGCIQGNAERLLEYWMTVFNPCVSKLNQVAAREFQERLHSTVMAAILLRKAGRPDAASKIGVHLT